MLTASTSGLGEETFNYQWVSNDGKADSDIQSATAMTYTLQTADVGKYIKVRATVIVDNQSGLTFTSGPTAAVAAASNSPPTGAPVINGTVQVGETLTAGRVRDRRPERNEQRYVQVPVAFE